MATKSWLVTLTPLAIAVFTTVKSFLFDTTLTEQEIEIIKYAVLAFIGSGAIGAYNARF